jgi:hypothetical protein
MTDLALNKEKIIAVLDDFPTLVLLEDFIDKMIITAKIEKALEQFDRGEYMTSEELDQEIEKWD